MRRLAIITTHPIQYYAPVFQLLAKEAVDVTVFYTWGEGSVKKYDPDFKRQVEWDIPLLEGYNYRFLPNTSANPGTSHFKGIVNPTALAEIDRFDPDAILVYGWAWQSHLKIIRHYGGKKAVWFRGDSTLLDETKGLKRLARRLFLRWIYRRITTAFYVGTQNRRYFEAVGFAADRLRFVPHAIDNDRFAAAREADAQLLRNNLGIPADGVLVLFAGKLEPKKDPITLLRAFLDLTDPNVYLLFAGNGVLENELKAMASASTKTDKVFFHGFQNQLAMPVLYQACQVFCLPSAGPGETWGLAVNEAMAAGKAVVVSDKVGCAADLVQEGVNGALFKAGDAEDLTKKLGIVTDANTKWRSFGQASQNIIRDWSFDAQVFSILEALNTK